MLYNGRSMVDKEIVIKKQAKNNELNYTLCSTYGFSINNQMYGNQ